MGKILISKKGKIPMFFIISGLCLIVAGIFSLSGAGEGIHYEEWSEMLSYMVPFFLLFAGVLLMVTAIPYSKAHIEICSDCIKGSLVLTKSGISCRDILITNIAEYQVFRDNTSTISISIDGEKYRICLPVDDANQVFSALSYIKKNGFADSNVTKKASTQTPPKSTAKKTETTVPKQEPKKAEAPIQKEVPPATESTTPEKVVCECPTCGAKLRIPAGKGKVRLNCPKCKNTFIANS